MRIDGASITVFEMTPFPIPLPRRRIDDGVRLYTRNGENMDMDADIEPLRFVFVSTTSVTFLLEEEGWPIAPAPASEEVTR